VHLADYGPQLVEVPLERGPVRADVGLDFRVAFQYAEYSPDVRAERRPGGAERHYCYLYNGHIVSRLRFYADKCCVKIIFVMKAATPLAEARLWATAETVTRELARGPYRSPVISNSMAPVARDGDAFVVVPLGRRGPRFGGVVAVVAGSRAVVHRVVGKRAGLYITKGDAAPRVDPPARPEDVLGLVRAVEKGDGSVLPLDTARARLAGAALAAISALENVVNGVASPPPVILRRLFYLALRLAWAAFYPSTLPRRS
jgi:hypothetical protein